MPCWMVARDSKQDPLSNAEWCTSHPKRRCWMWGTRCWANQGDRLRGTKKYLRIWVCTSNLQLGFKYCFWWMFKCWAWRTKTEVFGEGLSQCRCQAFKVGPFLGWPILLPTTRDLCFAAGLTTKQVRNRRVQSYSVSRLFEVNDFGYQITPNHQAQNNYNCNYNTIWINPKQRVLFFQLLFGSQETKAHSFLLPSHPVIQRLVVWHTSEIFHKTIQTTRPQTTKITKIPLPFRNLEESESNYQTKQLVLFTCFQKRNWQLGAGRPFERRRFFEGLGGCRRRGASGGWEQQPVAEAVGWSDGLVMRGRLELKGWIFLLLKFEMGASLWSPNRLWFVAFGIDLAIFFRVSWGLDISRERNQGLKQTINGSTACVWDFTFEIPKPLWQVLRPWLEFEPLSFGVEVASKLTKVKEMHIETDSQHPRQVLARVRAVRLHAAIYGQGLSVQMAFQRSWVEWWWVETWSKCLESWDVRCTSSYRYIEPRPRA